MRERGEVGKIVQAVESLVQEYQNSQWLGQMSSFFLVHFFFFFFFFFIKNEIGLSSGAFLVSHNMGLCSFKCAGHISVLSPSHSMLSETKQLIIIFTSFLTTHSILLQNMDYFSLLPFIRINSKCKNSNYYKKN